MPFAKFSSPASGIPQTSRVKLHSIGNHYLDELLCGGLPGGSLVIVEDSNSDGPSLTLAKCFLSYGCSRSDRLIADRTCQNLALPKCKSVVSSNDIRDSEEKEFKIAWRYSANHVSGDKSATKLHYDFDSEHFLCDYQNANILNRDFCDDPIKQLEEISYIIKLQKSQGDEMARVYLRFSEKDSPNHQEILKCLFKLKGLMRSCSAVAVVSLPYCTDMFVKNYLLMLADYFVKFEPFRPSFDSVNEALFKEYNGSVDIPKVWHYGSTQMHYKTVDLVYKFRRRNLVVEKGCLLPDLSETASRSEKRPELSKTHKTASELF